MNFKLQKMVCVQNPMTDNFKKTIRLKASLKRERFVCSFAGSFVRSSDCSFILLFSSFFFLPFFLFFLLSFFISPFLPFFLSSFLPSPFLLSCSFLYSLDCRLVLFVFFLFFVFVVSSSVSLVMVLMLASCVVCLGSFRQPPEHYYPGPADCAKRLIR